MTSGVHSFLNFPKGRDKRPLGVFIYACVCVHLASCTCVPCCDFTVGLVPTQADFTLLAPPAGVRAGGVRGEMPWGGGRERWFLVWVALSHQRESVCVSV